MKTSSICFPMLLALLVGMSSCTQESPLPQAPANEHTYGGAANEVAGDIVALPDGGFLIVGGSQNPKTSDYDLYILKVDANGEEVVSHTYGDAQYHEVGWKIAPTSGGAYAILGTKRPRSGGASLLQITLIDADFKMRWQASNHTNVPISELTLQGASFYELPDGKYITGYGTDYYPVVARFDAQGSILDENTYPEYYSDKYGHGFCRASDSSFVYFVTAREYSSGSGNISRLNYDRFGSHTARDEIYIGTFGRVDVHAATATLKDDYWLSLYDQYQGQHVVGVISPDFTTSSFSVDPSPANYVVVSELSSGNLLMAGYDAYPYRNGQLSDFRVQLVDATGNVIRSGTYGGRGDEMLLSMAAIPTGGAALLGETQSYGAGGTDLYLVFFKE